MNKIKIENLKRNGYQLDLGEIISQSLENYKKIALNAGLAIFILSIVFITITFSTIGAIYGFGDFAEQMTNFHLSSFSPLAMIFYVFGTALIGSLIFPFTAGIIHMANEGEMNRNIEFSMIFHHYKSNYSGMLLKAGFVISLILNVLNLFFDVVSLPLLGTLCSYIISYFTIFTIPLIIFSDFNFSDAIKDSFALVIKQPFVILISLIVAFIFAMFGLIALCIGIFFTIPLLYSTQYIIYKNAVGIDFKSEIEEIGNSSE